MKYREIERMCRPIGIGIRGCPHDGLGCIGDERCSINSPDPEIAKKAFNAEIWGNDFVCVKRQQALRREERRK